MSIKTRLDGDPNQHDQSSCSSGVRTPSTPSTPSTAKTPQFKFRQSIGGSLSDWAHAYDPLKRFEQGLKNGRQCFEAGEFDEAIDWLSEAVAVNKKSSLVLEYRSLCFQSTNQLEKALADAEAMVNIGKEAKNVGMLKNGWVRKSQVLVALEREQLAFNALTEANKLPVRCAFIAKQFKKIKRQALDKFRFERDEIDKCPDLDLFASMADKMVEMKRVALEAGTFVKPTNPFRYRALRITGIRPQLHQELVEDVLKECGPMVWCRLFKGRGEDQLAMVEYYDATAALNAIDKIQDQRNELVGDGNLEIRFRHTGPKADPQKGFADNHVVGECFHWRTSGDCRRSECQYLHPPVCKDIDRQLAADDELVAFTRTKPKPKIDVPVNNTPINGGGDTFQPPPTEKVVQKQVPKLDKNKLLAETKIIVKSLVIPRATGTSPRQLLNDYFEMEERDLPYIELGFSSLIEFLKSIRDCVRMIYDGPNITIFPVYDEATGHIQEMVAEQSKKRIKGIKRPRISNGHHYLLRKPDTSRLRVRMPRHLDDVDDTRSPRSPAPKRLRTLERTSTVRTSRSATPEPRRSSSSRKSSSSSIGSHKDNDNKEISRKITSYDDLFDNLISETRKSSSTSSNKIFRRSDAKEEQPTPDGRQLTSYDDVFDDPSSSAESPRSSCVVNARKTAAALTSSSKLVKRSKLIMNQKRRQITYLDMDDPSSSSESPRSSSSSLTRKSVLTNSDLVNRNKLIKKQERKHGLVSYTDIDVPTDLESESLILSTSSTPKTVDKKKAEDQARQLTSYDDLF